VVLSAETLTVSTVRVPRERVRISKRVVTSTRTVEVQVRSEELVITREPVSGAEGVSPAAGNDEIVVVLRAEVPEVSLRVQPVEVVRIGTTTVQGEDVVHAELRTEVADVEVVGDVRVASDGPLS
jgi:uncharacterized protein (TIGR02271 family)